MEQQKNDLDGAVGALKEQYQELAQRALLTVLTTGRQAENDKDMRAKRCFDAKPETMHHMDSCSGSSSGIHSCTH